MTMISNYAKDTNPAFWTTITWCTNPRSLWISMWNMVLEMFVPQSIDDSISVASWFNTTIVWYVDENGLYSN